MARATFAAAATWVTYIALETYVRRFWPQTMITWSRLLMCRFRDPLVGRDVLIGGLLGLGLVLVLQVDSLLPQWLGVSEPVLKMPGTGYSLGELLGLRYKLGTVIGVLLSAISLGLVVLLLMLLFRIVLRTPWPAMLRGLHKASERYKQYYWSMFPDAYLAGDCARTDEDGYFWIQGRADDVLKISGHRIGNSEIESALVSHPDVAEAVAIGKVHPIKGESISVYVVVKEEVEPNDDLRIELREHVTREIGKIARPDEVWFVKDVPKTRSGKIMRRVVRAKAMGEPPGDISTLRNPEAVEELDRAR